MIAGYSMDRGRGARHEVKIDATNKLIVRGLESAVVVGPVQLELRVQRLPKDACEAQLIRKILAVHVMPRVASILKHDCVMVRIPSQVSEFCIRL